MIFIWFDFDNVTKLISYATVSSYFEMSEHFNTCSECQKNKQDFFYFFFKKKTNLKNEKSKRRSSQELQKNDKKRISNSANQKKLIELSMQEKNMTDKISEKTLWLWNIDNNEKNDDEKSKKFDYNALISDSFEIHLLISASTI